MRINEWVAAVAASTLARTRSYFEEEFGIVVADMSQGGGDVATINIHGLTAIVGVGGPASLLVAFSFEQGLMDELYARMTDGIDIAAAEQDAYRGSVAGEIVNTIIGNCTGDLQNNGEAISLTPPMIVDSIKHIHRMKDAIFICRSLHCEFGRVDINLVGPSELFAKSLNDLK
ncbi:MAG: chemotaxis protein CheX [Rhodoferax sp.]|nr:chemotaxis protein CheX [Rhodoferax sp.]